MKEGKKMLIRGAGILMPVSALWSEGEIGTLGSAADRFAELLAESGQRYWQVLPVGPTSYGDSPYQPFSAFAGNPYFINLQRLQKDGLLRKSELPTAATRYINYAEVSRSRPILLKTAFGRFKPDSGYNEFCTINGSWLNGFALFMALKKHFGGAAYSAWDDDIRRREPDVVERYSEMLEKDVEFFKFCQYRFFSDWFSLKKYTNSLGVKIIGDMPIYVAPDSADIWMKPEQFETDADAKPIKVAGVPPDDFSESGQLWGNPIYNWDVMETDGFDWWRRRMAMASLMFDAVRIDHFIGFARYYSVKAGSADARSGRWRRGPGSRLTSALDEVRGDTDIIAEDLGIRHPAAERLLERTGYPGMNVLEFAFDEENSRYLPHNYVKNSVVYPATHDNDTVAGWLSKLDADSQRQISDYTGAKSRNQLTDAVIRTAYASVSELCIVQMQDVLGLGSSARMNKPSTATGNWKWRMSESQFGDNIVAKLRKLAALYGR